MIGRVIHPLGWAVPYHLPLPPPAHTGTCALGVDPLHRKIRSHSGADNTLVLGWRPTDLTCCVFAVLGG